MDEGLYETLITRRLLEGLSAVPHLVPEVHGVDPADQPLILGRHVGDAVERVLRATPDAAQRAALVNGLLRVLQDEGEQLDEPTRRLLRLAADPVPGRPAVTTVRPRTPLTEAALLTNAHGEPNLGAEIRAEIESADRVDLLCAFVKWHGLRLLEPELSALRERGVPFRVLTTTYIGGTERAALDRLVQEFGAEVRVQYEAKRTRLHAKAWLFRRGSGLDTAYIGSSNLTRAALLDGVEWNVRLARTGTGHLLDKFLATFDTYWTHAEYERYDPAVDHERLDDALAEASGSRSRADPSLNLSGLQVRAYPHQQEMLDALEAERSEHGRHENLVVAATGTGKTVVAALDYRRLCGRDGRDRPSLLFVAHRREILEQSLRTYREVLGDANFGELWVGGHRPEGARHVFASIQSMTAGGLARFAPDAFDIVVVDEFHHAEAGTYRRLLEHLRPGELLGLTATPERADGGDVRQFFGGRTAAELRLWDALGADLLCPFHYFALADGTDLRDVGWSGGPTGGYREEELSNLYTGNRARAEVIVRQVQDKVLHPRQMRALGFCAGVKHAEYMAEVFEAVGIPARAVSGSTPVAARRRALEDLRAGRVNILFAADLFNEGLDLPDIDTVLFLRPTESATIFLQQLGRGLRRTQDKAVLTVLDFVGQARREFRFDLKLRALTGRSRRQLEDDVDHGFPFLPSGCQIVMDEQASRVVLANIREQIATRWSPLVQELRSYGDLDLATFLQEARLELSDVVRDQGSRTWTRLRRDAGLPMPEAGVAEAGLLRRVRALAHVDDRDRARVYGRLLRDPAAAASGGSPFEQVLSHMLFFSLWPDGGGHADIGAGLATLAGEHAVREELRQVIDVAFDAARRPSVDLGVPALRDVPLRVHASYQREEVLAALGYAGLDRRRPNSFREGVLHVPDLDVDALFITLRKSEADYSPTTMYRDYPISPTLFHWESQSTTTLASPTGQRYVTGGSTVLLFVREQGRTATGTSPYLFLGPATHVDHRGERPIAITWRLEHEMPADVFAAASAAAG